MIAKQNFKKLIPISKSNLLSALGLVVLLFFIGLAYLNNSIFLDKIILCSLIFGMVLFSKLRGESNTNGSNSGSNDYTNGL
jgi:hypothetical protein